MKAVIVTGGKQYTVAEGDVLFIEKLNVEAEQTVKFEQVLAVLDGENTKIGAPVVEGAAVEAKVVKNGKGKKIHVLKYKAKKGEKKRSVIVSPTPRWKSPRSLCNYDKMRIFHGE